MKKYFLLFSSCFLGSCMYYSLAGSIPSHINSVAIPIVENQTAEFGMSESVTENLLAKFNEENILRVTDEESAVSVLNGTIVRVTDAPYTFTQQEAVTEYRFTVHMKIEWIDLSNDEILIQKNFFCFQPNILYTSNVYKHPSLALFLTLILHFN